MACSWWAVALLPMASAILKTQHRQILFHDQQIERPSFTNSQSVNYTFDDIKLTRGANYTIDHYDFLEFDQIRVFNATAAVEREFLASGDLNCAASKPNALQGFRGTFRSPSVIRTNATALAAREVQPYFDIVAFTWKPLGPAPAWSSLFMYAYQTDGTPDGTSLVDSMLETWFETGYLEPEVVVPGDYWPGWGEKVNWIEIEGSTDDGRELEFCIDNIVLRFYDIED